MLPTQWPWHHHGTARVEGLRSVHGSRDPWGPTCSGVPGAAALAVLAWLRGHPMVSRELRSGGAVPPRGAPPGSGGAHAGEEPVLVCSG